MISWLRRHGLTLVLIAVGVGAAVGAFVVGVQAGAATGSRQVVLLSIGGTLTAVGILLAGIDSLRRERARRTAEQVAVAAEEGLTLTLNGAIAPITSYLGELAITKDRSTRRSLVGQIQQAVVDAAVRLTAENSRSAFYVYDQSRNVLTRAAYGGRSTLPREDFQAGTDDGERVLGLVRRGELVFITDIRENGLVLPSADGYRTVIAVTVTAGTHRLGLLTVDAPMPGDLTEVDLELIRVLGNLLAGAIAQVL